MADYIERDKVLDAVFELPPKMDAQGYGWIARGGLYQLIRDFQSANVAPVVHGEWADEGFYADGSAKHAFHCSNCGHHIIEWKDDTSNYCPNCGAKMREENGRVMFEKFFGKDNDKDINVPCKTNADRIRSKTDKDGET